MDETLKKTFSTVYSQVANKSLSSPPMVLKQKKDEPTRISVNRFSPKTTVTKKIRRKLPVVQFVDLSPEIDSDESDEHIQHDLLHANQTHVLTTPDQHMMVHQSVTHHRIKKPAVSPKLNKMALPLILNPSGETHHHDNNIKYTSRYSEKQISKKRNRTSLTSKTHNQTHGLNVHNDRFYQTRTISNTDKTDSRKHTVGVDEFNTPFSEDVFSNDVNEISHKIEHDKNDSDKDEEVISFKKISHEFSNEHSLTQKEEEVDPLILGMSKLDGSSADHGFFVQHSVNKDGHQIDIGHDVNFNGGNVGIRHNINIGKDGVNHQMNVSQQTNNGLGDGGFGDVLNMGGGNKGGKNGLNDLINNINRNSNNVVVNNNPFDNPLNGPNRNGNNDGLNDNPFDNDVNRGNKGGLSGSILDKLLSSLIDNSDEDGQLSPNDVPVKSIPLHPPTDTLVDNNPAKGKRPFLPFKLIPGLTPPSQQTDHPFDSSNRETPFNFGNFLKNIISNVAVNYITNKLGGNDPAFRKGENSSSSSSDSDDSDDNHDNHDNHDSHDSDDSHDKHPRNKDIERAKPIYVPINGKIPNYDDVPSKRTPPTNKPVVHIRHDIEHLDKEDNLHNIQIDHSFDPNKDKDNHNIKINHTIDPHNEDPSNIKNGNTFNILNKIFNSDPENKDTILNPMNVINNINTNPNNPNDPRNRRDPNDPNDPRNRVRRDPNDPRNRRRDPNDPSNDPRFRRRESSEMDTDSSDDSDKEISSFSKHPSDTDTSAEIAKFLKRNSYNDIDESSDTDPRRKGKKVFKPIGDDFYKIDDLNRLINKKRLPKGVVEISDGSTFDNRIPDPKRRRKDNSSSDDSDSTSELSDPYGKKRRRQRGDSHNSYDLSDPKGKRNRPQNDPYGKRRRPKDYPSSKRKPRDDPYLKHTLSSSKEHPDSEDVLNDPRFRKREGSSSSSGSSSDGSSSKKDIHSSEQDPNRQRKKHSSSEDSNKKQAPSSSSSSKDRSKKPKKKQSPSSSSSSSKNRSKKPKKKQSPSSSGEDSNRKKKDKPSLEDDPNKRRDDPTKNKYPTLKPPSDYPGLNDRPDGKGGNTTINIHSENPVNNKNTTNNTYNTYNNKTNNHDGRPSDDPRNKNPSNRDPNGRKKPEQSSSDDSDPLNKHKQNKPSHSSSDSSHDPKDKKNKKPKSSSSSSEEDPDSPDKNKNRPDKKTPPFDHDPSQNPPYKRNKGTDPLDTLKDKVPPGKGKEPKKGSSSSSDEDPRNKKKDSGSSDEDDKSEHTIIIGINTTDDGTEKVEIIPEDLNTEDDCLTRNCDEQTNKDVKAILDNRKQKLV